MIEDDIGADIEIHDQIRSILIEAREKLEKLPSDFRFFCSKFNSPESLVAILDDLIQKPEWVFDTVTDLADEERSDAAAGVADFQRDERLCS